MNWDEFITMKEATKILCLGKTTIYDLMKTDATFPKLYKFSRKATRFKLSEIEEWAESKKAVA
jgi:predicted DNA-binding transcriptional regulator AlpA